MAVLEPEKNMGPSLEVPEINQVLPIRKSYRRRFGLAGAGIIGILLIALFTSYLQDSGSTRPAGPTYSVGSGNGTSSIVFPIGAGTAVPYDSLPGLTTLKYSGPTGVSPEWTPIPNYAGQVTRGGDIGVIDTTGAPRNVTVEITITNLENLAKSYSSFAFPLDIYEWCPTNTTSAGTGTPCGANVQTGPAVVSSTAGSWVPYENGTSYGVILGRQLFITDTAGSLSVTLPRGFYYDLAMDAHQGSYYCISTTVAKDLSPSFYISAKVR